MSLAPASSMLPFTNVGVSAECDASAGTATPVESDVDGSEDFLAMMLAMMSGLVQMPSDSPLPEPQASISATETKAAPVPLLPLEAEVATLPTQSQSALTPFETTQGRAEASVVSERPTTIGQIASRVQQEADRPSEDTPPLITEFDALTQPTRTTTDSLADTLREAISTPASVPHQSEIGSKPSPTIEPKVEVAEASPKKPITSDTQVAVVIVAPDAIAQPIEPALAMVQPGDDDRAETPASEGSLDVNSKGAFVPSHTQEQVSIRETPRDDRGEMRPAPIIRQVHDAIDGRMEQLREYGRVELKLNLHPPELGDVRMHLSLDDNVVSVHMLVDDESVKQVLEQHLEPLRVRFEEMGVQLGQLDVRRDGGHAERHATFDADGFAQAGARRLGSRPLHAYRPVASPATEVDLLV